jgi:hypothetical protein
MSMSMSPAEREELADCPGASLDPPDAFGGKTNDENKQAA